MFRDCSSLTSLDLSGWDISNIESLKSMFDGCSSLSNLKLPPQIKNDVNLMTMFSGCSSLTTLDLSGWDMAESSALQSMFDGCSSLTTIYLDNTNIPQTSTIWGIFKDCTSLNHIRCKQSFKDWCWTNQDLIKLPDAMRSSGGGTWEIVN